MIPMMLMNVRPIARIQAVKAWNQPAWADLGELTKMWSKSIRDCNAKGELIRDKNGDVITKYDGLPDSDFELSNAGTSIGRYADVSEDVPWQDCMDFGLFEDDVCYAYLGCETCRPSGGYEYHIKQHAPYTGTWKHLQFATAYVPFRPYRPTTGSNRLVDIHEINGACTVTLIDPADGDRETVTMAMLTDSDDLSNRPSVQTGNVAAHRGTIDTTITQALKLAGSINEPISQVIKVGSAASDAYDPNGVRTRWEDGKTWTVSTNSGYWASCFIHQTNYYGIEYSEGGECKLKAVPIYDYLTKQAGFQDEASPTNRLIFSQGRRPFKPVFDDGFIIPEEEGA